MNVSSGRGVRSSISALVVSLAVLGSLAGCGGGGGGSSGGTFVTTGSVSASKSTVAAAAASLSAPADGKTGIPITVTIKDSNGNPIANAVVTATVSGSGTIVTYSGISDSKGVVTVTLTSTVAQTETLTVTAYQNGVAVGTPLTQTVSVTFTAIPVGTAGSSIAVNPASVVADGTTASTVTVTVVDANGTAVPNANVTFTATGTSVTLAPTTPVATSGTGTASVALTSKTAQTGVTVQAAIAFPGSGTTTAVTLTSAPISFTAGTATSLMIETPPTFTAGVPNTLVVDIVDANGNLTSNNNEVALSLVNDAVAGTACAQRTNPVLGLPIKDNGSANGLNSIGNTIAVAVNGKATFPGLVFNRAGSYSTKAVATISGNTVTSSSASFNVQANVAMKLGFYDPSVLSPATGYPSQPINIDCRVYTTNFTHVLSGGNFAPKVAVQALDAFGNPTANLPAGDGAGGPMGATTGHYVQLTATGITLTNNTANLLLDATGKATFNVGDSGATAPTSFTLTATDMSGKNTLTAVTSSSGPFVNTAVLATAPAQGSAAKIVATSTPPTNQTVDSAFGVTLGFLDAAGNTGAATNLGGTFWIAFYNSTGLATFTASTSTPGASVSTASPATTLYVTYPTTTTFVALSIQIQTPGTWTLLVYDGYDHYGAGATQSTILAGSTQANFKIGAGVIKSLAYTMQTCGLKTGAFTPAAVVNTPVQVNVSALDQFGNVTSDLTGTTSALTITGGTGTLTTVPAAPALSNGKASFTVADNTVETAQFTTQTGAPTPVTTGKGSNVSFIAAATAGTSGTPLKLVFLNQPPSTVVSGADITGTGNGGGTPTGATISNGKPSQNEIDVQVQDSLGQGVPGITVTVSFQGSPGIGTNGSTTSAAGGTLNGVGGSLMSDAQGIVHIRQNHVQESAVGLEIVATAGAVNPTCSGLLDVVAGAADFHAVGPSLFLDVNSAASGAVGNVLAGANTGTSSTISPAAAGQGLPVIQVFDDNGNVATTFGGTARASLNLVPAVNPSGVLAGTTSVNFVSGVAVFGGLNIAGAVSTTTTPAYFSNGLYVQILNLTNGATHDLVTSGFYANIK